MVSSTRFWDLIAKRYSRTPITDESAYQKKLEITQTYFNADTEVLEFGCGTGSTALIHAAHVKHILAIDFSENMIKIAEEKRIASRVENVRFECKTIDDIDPDEKRYDVILGLSVLHLMKDWRETITKINNLLKADGIFVSSTACIGDSMKYFKYIASFGRMLGVLPDLEVFTTHQLVNSLTSNGFEIEREWQPGKNKAVFIVARKPACLSARRDE